MHRYRGLLEGRYRHPVIALTLLIEPLSKAQSSGVYRWEGYGTRVSYEFPVFRIYEGDEEALKASENPFDWAHLAGLRAWKSRGCEARKLDYLKEMLSLLEERGWSHADKLNYLVYPYLRRQRGNCAACRPKRPAQHFQPYRLKRAGRLLKGGGTNVRQHHGA